MPKGRERGREEEREVEREKGVGGGGAILWMTGEAETGSEQLRHVGSWWSIPDRWNIRKQRP